MFPSKLINALLSGLKRYMTQRNPYAPNTFVEKDPRFKGLHGTRDTPGAPGPLAVQLYCHRGLADSTIRCIERP